MSRKRRQTTRNAFASEWVDDLLLETLLALRQTLVLEVVLAFEYARIHTNHDAPSLRPY